MPDGLYELDALAWAEQQATLLRRLLRAVMSLLQQAMTHLLKRHA
jgi:hypothetical protein